MPTDPLSQYPLNNPRQRMVRAGRCRECGAKGHTPHTDECSWIGGVCEYQLQSAEPTEDTPNAD